MSNILFPLHCPNCGKGISDSDTLCPHCGMDLDAPLEKTELQALAQPYLEKAQKALESGRNLKDALFNCNKAIEYTPESAEAHNLRGLILDIMGKPDKAILAYREAIRLNPDLVDAKDNLANLETEYPKIDEFSNQQQMRWIKNIMLTLAVGMCLFALTGATMILYVFGRPLLTPKHEVVFEPDRSKVSTVTPEDLKKTVEILKQRWKSLGYGASWVSFTISDKDQIIAQLPTEIELYLINRTKVLGLVEFVDFGEESFPEGMAVNTDVNANYFPQVTGKKWHTIMTNSEIRSAVAQKSQGESYEIAFFLTEKGTKILGDYSAQHVGSYLGIVMDKVVVSCPRISAAIPNGEGVISGNFTQESAQNLAMLLQTSPLPIPLK